MLGSCSLSAPRTSSAAQRRSTLPSRARLRRCCRVVSMLTTDCVRFPLLGFFVPIRNQLAAGAWSSEPALARGLTLHGWPHAEDRLGPLTCSHRRGPVSE